MILNEIETQQWDTVISEDEFNDRFGFEDSPDRSILWQCWEPEFKKVPENRIWTVVDDSESNDPLVIPGRHLVNKFAYAVSIRPRTIEADNGCHTSHCLRRHTHRPFPPINTIGDYIQSHR